MQNGDILVHFDWATLQSFYRILLVVILPKNDVHSGLKRTEYLYLSSDTSYVGIDRHLVDSSFFMKMRA